MTLLQTRNLSVTLADPLFSGLDLTLNRGDRLGLVAPNGRGKTTLLGCLAGRREPTAGEITRARGLRCALVAQYVPAETREVALRDFVLSALAPEMAEAEGWRVDVALGELGVPLEMNDAPLGTLSGGWQRMALLAAAWVSEPDVLLLDEPTNHLDLARIGALQRWLGGLPRDLAVIAVSHDRAFLDAVTTRTLFLRDAESRAFPLPYSAARAALDESDAADARRHANDMAKAGQLRRQAAKLKNIGINSGSDLLVVKTKQLSERAAKLEAAAKPAFAERDAGDIRLANSGSHARALVTLDEVEVTTPDGRMLYRTGRLWIEPGDRVVLLGPNGAGKSQLVRLVADAMAGRDSPVRIAPSVVTGFADQHLGHLDPKSTPFAAVTADFDLGDQRARGLLAGAGIAHQMQDGPLSRLSGGQRARLALLILRLTRPNFYLLDEPTNHLDIAGQDALLSELVEQGAACLLVSHDRHFLTEVGTRFWCIEGRRLVEVADPAPFLSAQLSAA